MADIHERILRQLRDLGVAYITAEYSGSDDSGQFDGITVQNAAGETIEFDLDKPVGEEAALKVKRRLLDEEDKPLSDQIEVLVWDTIDEMGHSGFWNNEGGQGTMKIDVAAGTIVLVHGNNGEDTRDYDEETEEYIGENNAAVDYSTWSYP